MGNNLRCRVCSLILLTAAVSSVAQEKSAPEQSAQVGATPDRPAVRTLAVPIELPDLTALEQAVAEQIRNDYQTVEELLHRPGVKDQELAEVVGLLGQTFHAYAMLDAARTSYHNAHLLVPESFAWTYLEAEVLAKQGALEQAIELFEQAHRLDPSHLPCLVRLGDCLLQLNRLDEAWQVYEQAAALDPSAPAVSAGLGKVALSRHDLQVAVEHLSAALAAVPAANRLHYSLAMAYRGLGEQDLARQHLQLSGSVGLRVEDPLIDGLRDLIQGERAFVLRGRLAFAAGRFGEAAVAFAKAVAAAPESTTALVNLGSAIGMIGDIDGAIERFEQAVAIEPDNLTAHHNLGELLVHERRLLEAEQHLRKAVELNDDDPRPHLLLANVLRGTGRHDEAIDHYATAIDLDPASDVSYLGLAEILISDGRVQEASSLLIRAHEQLPEEGRIAHALARLLATAPDPKLRNGAQAVALAQQVVSAAPIPLHMETLALALAELGECAEAAGWQGQVIVEVVAANDLSRLPDLRETLLRYRAGSPCRLPFPSTASGVSQKFGV